MANETWLKTLAPAEQVAEGLIEEDVVPFGDDTGDLWDEHSNAALVALGEQKSQDAAPEAATTLDHETIGSQLRPTVVYKPNEGDVFVLGVVVAPTSDETVAESMGGGADGQPGSSWDYENPGTFTYDAAGVEPQDDPEATDTDSVAEGIDEGVRAVFDDEIIVVRVATGVEGAEDFETGVGEADVADYDGMYTDQKDPAEGGNDEDFSLPATVQRTVGEPDKINGLEDPDALVKINELLGPDHLSEKTLKQAVAKQRRKDTRSKIWAETKAITHKHASAIGAYALGWVHANDAYARKKSKEIERTTPLKPDTSELGKIASVEVSMAYAAHRATEGTAYAARKSTRTARTATRSLYLPTTAVLTGASGYNLFEALGSGQAETTPQKVAVIAMFAASLTGFVRTETQVGQEHAALQAEKLN